MIINSIIYQMESWILLLLIFIIGLLVIIILQYKSHSEIIEDYPEYNNGHLHDNVYIETIFNSPLVAKKQYDNIKMLDNMIISGQNSVYERIIKELSISGLNISRITLTTNTDGKPMIVLELTDYDYKLKLIFEGDVYKYLIIDSLPNIKNIESFTAFISLQKLFLTSLKLDVMSNTLYNDKVKIVIDPVVFLNNYSLKIQVTYPNGYAEFNYVDKVLSIGDKTMTVYNNIVMTGVNDNLIVNDIVKFVDEKLQ